MSSHPRIEVGDLVKIKQASSYYLADHTENNNVTGIVVDVTLDDESDGTLEIELDYWVHIVFLDNTKATLFHDEVEIIGAKKDTK